jgi:uncharacterized membrane protein YtjA (UPF0391 family)
MAGWTILYALIAATGSALPLTGIQSVVAQAASLLFTLLFMISVLTRLIRARAR